MIRADPPRQRFRGTFLKQRLDGAPLGTNLGQAQLGGAFASDHHEIDPRGQELRQPPKALTAEPLDAVASHRAAHATPDDEPEARRTGRRRLSRHEQGEVSRPHAAARTLSQHELAVLAKPPLDARHRVRQPLLLVDGRHEALATLAAAILKDFPATVRRHSGAEAVGACPADVVRLVGALHEGARKKAPPGASVKLALPEPASREALT